MGLKKKNNKNTSLTTETVNSINDEDFLKTTVNKNTMSLDEDVGSLKVTSSKEKKDEKFEWALNLNLPIFATLTFGFLGGASLSYIYSEQSKSQKTQIESYVLSIDKSLEKIEKNSLTIRTDPKESIDSLAEEKKNINQILDVLKNGGSLNTKIETKPIAGQALDTLNKIESNWRIAEKSLNNIVAKKENIVKSKDIINKLNKETGDIMKQVSTLQKILENKSSDNIQFASELSVSVYKILNEVASADIKVLTEGEKQFLYTALGSVSDTIGIIKDLYSKDNEDVLQVLNTFEKAFSKHLDKTSVVENISILNDAASQSINLDKNTLQTKSNIPVLKENIAEDSFSGILGFDYETWSLILALFGALFLALISLSLYARWVRSEKLAKVFKKNQSNEKALVELLGLIQPLDDGDFTKEIVLEDKFLKQVAIAIDTTRQRFGNIVRQMKSSSGNILEAAGTTDQSSQELSSLSKKQFEKLSEAINVISDITNSIDEVAQTAYLAQDESSRSSVESEKGKKLVDESIEKMVEIRNTIQESSKKIKKLGESAQSINEVTSLIKDITKQINILALNAAIQAASSGESGREFTVVAQEVQRLADDSENATKKIEELINDIQSDTAAAIASMEKTTQEVVIGAQLTEQAGAALNNINTLSKNTAEQIMAASTKLEEKSSEMASVTFEMQGLQKIAQNAQQAVDVTTTQVEALKQVSEQLEEAFKQYKV